MSIDYVQRAWLASWSTTGARPNLRLVSWTLAGCLRSICPRSVAGRTVVHMLFCSFFFYSSGDHRDLHSFPTRRSSDLSYGVTLTVSDKDSGSGTDSKTVNVVDVAPGVTINGAPVSSAEGTAVMLTSTVSGTGRSEEHTSELQSLRHLVCRLLLENKKKQ